MAFPADRDQRELTALLIAPDRDLARQFRATLPATAGFQVLAELRNYPPQQTLAIRLRQLQPEVVLLDLATNFEQAAEVIRCVIALNPAIHVIGLHARNDSEDILRALRQGASEFLCAPFDAAVQHQALARIRRLIEPRAASKESAGAVVALTSAKPGSGASTLAAQVSLVLSRQAGKKVLVADLDPMSATVSFYFNTADGGKSGGDAWSRVVLNSGGPDLLPAGIALPPLHEFLERARSVYDWIILDLPPVFHRASLLALPEAGRTFLVTTAELPSLHLARKAVKFLAQLGFGRERVRVLVNRVERRPGLAASDIEKVLNAPVHRSFPDDYPALDRALVQGGPLPASGALAKAIGEFAAGLSSLVPAERSGADGAAEPVAAAARH